MVRVVFEREVTATIPYPAQDAPETVMYEGRNYTLVGESAGDPLSCSERLMRLVALIGLAVAIVLTLFIPLAFKSVRSLISDWATEICSGGERVFHWHSPNHGDYYQIPEDMARQFAQSVTEEYQNYLARIGVSSTGAVTNHIACCVVITVNGETPDYIQFLFQKEDRTFFTLEGLTQQFQTMENDIERLLTPLRVRNINVFNFKYLTLLGLGHFPPIPIGGRSRSEMDDSFDNFNDPLPTRYRPDDLQAEFQWLNFPISEAMQGNNFIAGAFLNTKKHELA